MNERSFALPAWAATRRLGTAAILIIAVALCLAFFGASYPGFLSTYNLLNIAVQTAAISVVAFGMTLVIIARGIDLSVGSTLAFASIMGALVLTNTGNAPLAVVATVAVAVAVGAFNGFLVSVLRINAFMVTLGVSALTRGAAISLSGGAAVPIRDPLLLTLGRGAVGPVPWSIIMTVLGVVVFSFVLRGTVLGRWTLGAGGNENAAIASGVPSRLATWLTFVFLGFLVGVAALLIFGRAGSAQPMAGLGLEFSAITAAVIGGASLAGGRGSIVSTLLGSVFVGVLTSGLSFANVDQSLIYVYTGVLTVAAVVIAQREVRDGVRDNAIHLANSVRALMGARSTSSGTGGAGVVRQRHELAVEGLCKSFSGVEVLKGVDFAVGSGEVTALLGENGAGKSTIVKILCGIHQPTAGQLLLDGTPVRFSDPDDARKAGIAVIHQHFSLVPELTVAQNLFLGAELRAWRGFGPLRRREMRRRANELLAELGVPFTSDQRVADLTVGHRQMLEVARTVHEDAWLVLMDEPSSALSARERDQLYDLVRRLESDNRGVLFISHKMEEVYALCSRAIVLRDGAVVGEPDLSVTESREIVAMMVGREVSSVFPYRAAEVGEVVLSVENASDGGLVRGASLHVRSGEVVGLFGLMGAGRTELIEMISGLRPCRDGSITALGLDVRHSSLDQLARKGLAFVPEDRHENGIFPEMSARDNASMIWIRTHSHAGVISSREEARMVDGQMEGLGVRPPNPKLEIKNFSGGNQQKLVLAKWLSLDPGLILLDDPTRGVDVGAKAEIHRIIAERKMAGAAVVVTSSEPTEVLSIADRIVIMRDGMTVREFARGVSEEEAMQAAFGQDASAPEEMQS